MKKINSFSISLLLFATFLFTAHTNCSQTVSDPVLTWPDFTNNDEIPMKYTCEGEDISPPLTWDHLPKGTESIALIVDDPDAPRATWVHWLIFNIPASAKGLSEDLSGDEEKHPEILQGKNDFGNIGWGGPCPPKGHGTHRYFFKMYALDITLDLKEGANKKSMEAAMEGHILGSTEIMGVYKRE